MRRRTIIGFALLVVGLPILALALVIGADLIPDRLVMDRLHEAVVAGHIDANSYSVGYAGGRVDEFSECKRLTVGLGAPEQMNVVESAVRSPTLGPCDLAVPKIVGWAQGEGLTRAYYYFRYWNGSAVVLRPSVAVIGVAGVRILAGILLALAALAFSARMSRSIGRTATLLFIAPVLMTTDFLDLPGALVHALGMIVALTSAALILRLLTANSSLAAFAGSTFVAGAAFLFLADLTNPDAAWAMATVSAAVVAVDVQQQRQRLDAAAWRVGAATLGWISGFAWMWVSKWVIASVVIGYDTVRLVVSTQMETRLSGEIDGSQNRPFDGLRGAWSEWWNEPLTGAVVVALLTIAGVSMYRADLRGTATRRLLLGAAAVIPFVWHAVMRNHTSLHGWFTYRSMAVAFGIVLLACTARIPARRPASGDAQPPGDDEASSSGGTFDVGTITR